MSEKSQNLVRQFCPKEEPVPAKKVGVEEPPKFVPKDVAQQILLTRIERLEQIVIKLDQRNAELEKHLNLQMARANRNVRNDNFTPQVTIIGNEPQHFAAPPLFNPSINDVNLRQEQFNQRLNDLEFQQRNQMMEMHMSPDVGAGTPLF